VKKLLACLALQLLLVNDACCLPPLRAADDLGVPILAFHRFGPTVADSMTVRTSTFAWQLRYLRDHGYTVIKLQDYVDYRRGLRAAPPARAVIITADDGHRSVYSEMLPLVRRAGIPVTLFVYPSAISHASYALTWSELAELTRSGLFTVESHTYWHPNFQVEKARLSPVRYLALVRMQLALSKRVLQQRLGISVDLLAWPYGIYDQQLMDEAHAAGYVAALALGGRPARSRDPLLGLPRFLMTDRDVGTAFARLLGDEASEAASHARPKGRS
jgi:peptidoglycan/xylan/chitin deacetylase (PgdA/CDA1 family)